MTLNAHHRRARAVLVVTVTLDMLLGLAFGYAERIGPWHGIYCATATATTVGCDVTPRGWLAYAVSFAMLFSIVPLAASVLALFTTGLTADHIDARHDSMKRHIRAAYQGHEPGPATPPEG